jgi:Flp pilus assembly protein TadD
MTTDLTRGRRLVDVFSDLRIDGMALVPGADMDGADAYRFSVDLVRQRRYRDAVELLEPLAARHPDHSVRELLARAYFGRAQLAKAEELFRGLVADRPDDAFLREALARTVRRRSRHAEADGHERVALALR